MSMELCRLFAFFRQRYEGRVEIGADGDPYQVPDPRGGYADERLHLAVSSDGRHFKAINEGRAVYDRWMRDPFLARAPDGLWHLVATARPRGSILHATSSDLASWQDEDIPVASCITDEAGRQARNAWAPEWVWDASTGEYLIFWSSSFEAEGWMRSRLYASRTRDWKVFTPPTVLFAPPYSVIDGSLLEHDGRWWLFHKEEEFGPTTGERRAIRLAIADQIEGPYFIEPIPIAPTITEGPSVAPDPTSPGWLLYFDYCMSDGYGIARSEDLTRWDLLEDSSFPEGARHGSVSPIVPDDLAAIQARFGRDILPR